MNSREELIKKGKVVVRKDSTLFNDFVTYVQSDLRINDSCKGCSFSQRWEQWVRFIKSGKEIVTNKNNTHIMRNKDYKEIEYLLKDKNFKDFHKGEVVSINSSAETWINYLNTVSDRAKAENLFIVLPVGYESDTVDRTKEEEIYNSIMGKSSDNNIVEVVESKETKKKGRKPKTQTI